MLTIDMSLIRMLSEGPEVGLMGEGALAAEITLFDILLGIIPGTTGIGHEHGKRETASQTANQQPHHTSHTQDDTHEDGDEDGKY